MLIKSLQAFFDYCLCVSDTEFNCRSHQQIASVLADEEHKTCSQACYVLILLLRLVWLKTQQALTFMETKQMSVLEIPKKYIHLKLSSTFNNAGWQNHNPASQWEENRCGTMHLLYRQELWSLKP